MIPDVVQDSVTDTAKRLSYQYTEQVFYHASLEAGYSEYGAKDKARELDTLWKREGFVKLPDFVKRFCLDVCGGQHISDWR